MDNPMNIIICVVILIAACVLTQLGVVWKTKRACLTIIKDLQDRKACDPEFAVSLPYAQKRVFSTSARETINRRPCSI